MDDLISRQVLLAEKFARLECALQANKDAHFDVYKRGWNDALQTVYDNAPSAQKKGHWRNYEGTLTCSVCETEFDNGIMEYCGDNVPMFCPYCGADMIGENDG